MDFLTKIENNSILVIPNNIKNKILKYINENNLLINIKLISFDDIKKGLFYDYTNEAIYNIMTKYNISYDVAKDYIENTYYITENSYNNKNLNNLLEIKKELEINNLLIKDNLFTKLLSSKSKLYVYGYDYITKYNNYLLSLIKDYIDVELIEKENKNYEHSVYELDTLEDEVHYVFENISKLITEGIPLEKIYIVNYSEEYSFTFNKLSKQYNIPIYTKSTTTLFNTAIGKYFLNNLSNNITTLLEDIKKKYKVETIDENAKVFNKLFNLINTYYWTTDYVSIKKLIESEMKNIRITKDHYLHEITTTSLTDNYFTDDEYVFLIGFNLGVIPSSKKDEDYLTDNIKPSFIEKTLDFNKANKESVIKAISNIKNLTITYKNISTFNKYIKSYLVDDGTYKSEKINVNYSNYSDEYNKVLYANKIDKLIKFNEKDETLNVLNNNYSIPYNEYDNNFTGINNMFLMHELQVPSKWDPTKPKHSYSYSNISTYFKCPFRFYLDNFYGLNDYEQTLDAFIGSLYHYVLEKCVNHPEMDVIDVYDAYIKNEKDNKRSKEITIKDEYFLNKLKDECVFLVNAIRDQYDNTNYLDLDENHEVKIEKKASELDLDVIYEATLKGFVDKLLVFNDDVVIVDYKTGSSDKIDPRYFEFGMYIQLPIYLYLLKNENVNRTVVGMYLQHILPSLPIKDKKKTVDELKINNLKLDGLTLTDEEKLKEFDKNYEASTFVQSLKVLKKDGSFPKSARLIDYDKEKEIYDTIKNLIETCINNVANGNFNIKPIKVGKNINGCTYCPYIDICYRRKNQYDIKYITTETEEGEENE